MKKRWMYVLSVVMVLSLALSGCGGGDDKDGDTPEDQVTQGAIEESATEGAIAEDDAAQGEDAASSGSAEQTKETTAQTQTASQSQNTKPQSQQTQSASTPASSQTSSQTSQSSSSQTSAPQQETTPPQQEAAAPTKSDAAAYIGQSKSSLVAAIGSPSSSDYAPSCMGEGEDGELHYNGFTVYTYRENGVETVTDVI